MLGVNGRLEEGYAPFDEMEEMQMLITNIEFFYDCRLPKPLQLMEVQWNPLRNRRLYKTNCFINICMLVVFVHFADQVLFVWMSLWMAPL